MARVIVVDFVTRSRPRLVTPAKGSDGDMTNESQRPYTDINFILKRYAGNLAELNAWRGKMQYGDQSAIPTDLVDAFNTLKDAHDAFDRLEDNPFKSFEDAMQSIADGTFMDKVAKKSTTVDPSGAINDPQLNNPPKEPVKTTVNSTTEPPINKE